MALLEGTHPVLSYHTEISAGGQTQEFLAQLRKAVFAAVPGFVRANPPWESLNSQAAGPRRKQPVRSDQRFDDRN